MQKGKINVKKELILFVDDESAVCDAAKKVLERNGYRVLCMDSARRCLEFINLQDCSLVITDFNMPEMNGIKLAKEIKKKMPTLPVLVVTGYGNIPMAVRAVKAGVADVIEKPLNSNILLAKVKKLLHKNYNDYIVVSKKLSETEEKMLQLILTGKTNREIADIVFRSVRTVEDHRRRIMAKMGAHNIVELVKTAAKMGYVDTE